MTDKPPQNKPPQPVEQAIEKILERVPDELREELRGEIISFSAFSFSGPLPPAESFARYEEVLPGAADRIMRMAEKEQDNRKIRTDKADFLVRLQVVAATFIHIMSIGAFIAVAIYYLRKGELITGAVFAGLGVAPPILLRITQLILAAMYKQPSNPQVPPEDASGSSFP